MPDDQLSLAIGRRGQNVRLACQLTGWDIDILTEAEESERRQEEFRTRTALFIEALDVDDVIAHCWSPKASPRSRTWPMSTTDEIAGIEGFDEDIAEELQEPRASFLERTPNSTNAAASWAWPTRSPRSRG